MVRARLENMARNGRQDESGLGGFGTGQASNAMGAPKRHCAATDWSVRQLPRHPQEAGPNATLSLRDLRAVSILSATLLVRDQSRLTNVV